ncbi:MAG: ATP-binding protein [Verrucomicrobiales bacterium]|nr:ATP-binding protein [Verrucomicrobiales bacterium]
MSRLPGIPDTVDLLRRLRATLADFAQRERAVEEVRRTQDGRLRERERAAAGRRDESTAAAIRQAEVACEAARERAEQRHAARAERIARAHQSAQRLQLKQVEEEESRRKFEIQRDLLQTTRNRDGRLQAEEEAHRDHAARLADAEAGMSGVEARAADTLRGYPRLLRRLGGDGGGREVSLHPDPGQQLADCAALTDEAAAALRAVRRTFFPLLARVLPWWLLAGVVVLLLAGGVWLAPELGWPPLDRRTAGLAAGAAVLGFGLLHVLGGQLAAGRVALLAERLGRCRDLHAACAAVAQQRHEGEQQSIRAEHDHRTQALNLAWEQAVDHAAEAAEEWRRRLDDQRRRALASNDRQRREILARIERECCLRTEALRREAQDLGRQWSDTQQAEVDRMAAAHTAGWRALLEDHARLFPGWEQQIESARTAVRTRFPAWDSPEWARWQPATEPVEAVRVGEVRVDLAGFCDALPADPRLAFGGSSRIGIPLLLSFPRQGSLLLSTQGAGREQAIAALNATVLRLLAMTPPGRIDFTIIDPVELGQNFAGLMHLADYEERVIRSRIWTQPGQIEEQLTDLGGHVEKVTQMYLRNEYEDLAAYNAQAGRMAEKYRFLVVADFPEGFTDLAVRKLLSLAASGPRCGVFLLLHWDRRRPAPPDLVAEDLERACGGVICEDGHWRLGGLPAAGIELTLEPAPDAAFTTRFLRQVGQGSVDAGRVEVPFTEILPDERGTWSLETTAELRVPIGLTGATKRQHLAIGRGTRQHVLIAGKTGSGKSNLFHVIVTNLALWCRPDRVEFYLVDFKKGVEFKCYATHRLPHARVVAIESDREFGLSVLQRVDEEMRRRGELFRDLGIQDLPGYQRASGGATLPRTLLIIDEFQEFFVEDDRVSQAAAMLLDRIVRQGRAFGIHVLLGSQTLGGAYTLARTTLGQMVVRIALQCNEADAYLIMDEDNPAPRLLSRPGEAIYNDASGMIEGNNPFQVVWLDDTERDTVLRRVRRLADEAALSMPAPVVFEGNAPAQVRDNERLTRALAVRPVEPPAAGRVWLGAPNSIKGPTEAVFHRQGGHNLLIVGQRDEASVALLGVAMISLAAQYPTAGVRFVLLTRGPAEAAGARFFGTVLRGLPHPVDVPAPAEVPAVLRGLLEELDRRADPAAGGDAAPVFVLVHDLQKFKELRHEEDFGFSLETGSEEPGPGAQLNRLITEGPGHGLHVICTCDSANNLHRFLSRKAISEFELRVLFQMSANDSAALIDTPHANNLGLHRAIYHNGQEGITETFRPYALPDDAWLADVAARFQLPTTA